MRPPKPAAAEAADPVVADPAVADPAVAARRMLVAPACAAAMLGISTRVRHVSAAEHARAKKGLASTLAWASAERMLVTDTSPVMTKDTSAAAPQGPISPGAGFPIAATELAATDLAATERD
jgi:hypothetical protein